MQSKDGANQPQETVKDGPPELPFQVQTMNQVTACFDGVLKSIQGNLANEATAVMETQVTECNLFQQDILSQVKSVNAQIVSMKKLITDSRDDSNAKSFMKHKLSEYLDALPELDGDKLKELFETDRKTCEYALSNAKANAEVVSQQYSKMIKDIQSHLKATARQIDGLMFGNATQVSIVRKDIGPTKIVYRGEFEWDDNGVLGNISRASRIRIGVQTLRHGANCTYFFSEEENKDSRGITYFMDLYGGNKHASPGYKEKGGFKQPDAKLYHHEDLLKKNEKCWFEFEWNLESGHMQISSIKDERGREKRFLHQWPQKDFKLNYLWFVSAWDESAMVTCYIINDIINGKPSDQQLDDYFDSHSPDKSN